MFIEVMYADFDGDGKLTGTPRVREPIDNIGTMRKEGVLFITLSTGFGDRKNLVARNFSRFNTEGKQWYGDDHYAVGFIAGRFFIKQWSDEDEYILTRSLADPLNTTYTKHPIKQQLWPPEAEVHQFDGALIPMADWNAALEVFKQDMF